MLPHDVRRKFRCFKAGRYVLLFVIKAALSDTSVRQGLFFSDIAFVNTGTVFFGCHVIFFSEYAVEI